MVIPVADMYVKIDTVDVKAYVIGYDMRGGIALPFPILDMRLHSANAVDDLVTIAQGSIVDVYACGQGTFMVEKVEREDNQLHILAVHSSAILRTKVSATGFTGQPEAIFSAIAQSIGYAVGDVVTTTTSYGSVTTLPGERLLDTIRYLSQLTGCRYMFDEKAYFRSVADMNSSTVNIGTATPNTYPIYRPSIDADSATLINSVKVVHELGEILDDDSTSIATNGERFSEFRCLSTTTSAGVKPTADATAQASRILTDNKDKKVGLSYEVSERTRDGTTKVWSQTYSHVSKATITDNLSGTTLTAVPLNVYQHKYPQFSSVYHWNAGGTDDLSSELSGLWSDVDNMVYSGTVGNDLSSRAVALQVYGDQTLSEFNPATLTGFYLGKFKDGSGNDVYIWAGVNSGTEQVRMDTDGKIKAGAGEVEIGAEGIAAGFYEGQGIVMLDRNGLRIRPITAPGDFPFNRIRFVDSSDKTEMSLYVTTIGGVRTGTVHSSGKLELFGFSEIKLTSNGTTEIGSPLTQVTAWDANDTPLKTTFENRVLTEGVGEETLTKFEITQDGLYYYSSGSLKIHMGPDRLDCSNSRVRLRVYTPSTGYPSSSGNLVGDMVLWKDGGTFQILVWDGSNWRIEDL